MAKTKRNVVRAAEFNTTNPYITSYVVTVDYDCSLEEMINAGKYDWVSDDITQEHFSHYQQQGIVEITLELIHFNRELSSIAVDRQFKELGFRSAILQELLSLGKNYPEIQRKFPIAALGSMWAIQDHRPSVPSRSSVPYLSGNGKSRGFGLSWDERVWYQDFRFLGVRK
jgi:hypothetical protein